MTKSGFKSRTILVIMLLRKTVQLLNDFCLLVDLSYQMLSEEINWICILPHNQTFRWIVDGRSKIINFDVFILCFTGFFLFNETYGIFMVIWIMPVTTTIWLNRLTGVARQRRYPLSRNNGCRGEATSMASTIFHYVRRGWHGAINDMKLLRVYWIFLLLKLLFIFN